MWGPEFQLLYHQKKKRTWNFYYFAHGSECLKDKVLEVEFQTQRVGAFVILVSTVRPGLEKLCLPSHSLATSCYGVVLSIF
jgi:hypothetical protein